MSKVHLAAFAAIAVLVSGKGLGAAMAQQTEAPATHSLGDNYNREQQVNQSSGGEALLGTPVSNLHPGGVTTAPDIKNPVADDPSAAMRGMQYFEKFNCVGCHAPNGGGGMGRSLSKRDFLYGSTPANIFLTIKQGRPNGMPMWGDLLPTNVIWDLVAYIEQLRKAPQTEWGTTISASSPSLEQVPAEFQQTTTPWEFVEPFSHGQMPEGGNGGK